jgi:predicted nucleotidyltransferase
VETTVLDKVAILRLLREHRRQLIAFGVSRIGLFGSYVRGVEGAGSDIDILVHYRKGAKSLRNLVGLADFLEALFNVRVDLVTAESLSPITGHHIKNEVEYAAIAD